MTQASIELSRDGFSPVDTSSVYKVNEQFGFRKANRQEFDEGITLAERLIGSDLADRELIWALDNHTTITVWVCGHPISGVHIMVPLTAAGTEAMRRGLFDPANPNLLHCARPTDPCAGVYVGAYAGDTRQARKNIMQGAAFIRVACFGQVPCFARAATGDGARSMTSLGFQPVSNQPDALWVQEALQRREKGAA